MNCWTQPSFRKLRFWGCLEKRHLKIYVKVTQINYVSRNQLHSTANLNFGLMCKKGKTFLSFIINFSVQLIVLLDHVLLLAELAQNSNYFKIAARRSDSMKRNFGGFTFKHINFLPPIWIGEILNTISKIIFIFCEFLIKNNLLSTLPYKGCHRDLILI